MFGNPRSSDGNDVARDVMLSEVCAVGALRLFIPLGRKDALATDTLEAHAQSADAGEEVNEAKRRRRVDGSNFTAEKTSHLAKSERFRGTLPAFPAFDRTRRSLDRLGEQGL